MGGPHGTRPAIVHPDRTYLDHAATTPLRPEALEAMLPVLSDDFGNPSGAHVEAQRARITLDDARDRIARSLGVGPGEVVLTSGGTEADNLAVIGGWEGRAGAWGGPGAPVVVCSAMEHHAVLNACAALARWRGVELRTVPSGPDGIVDLGALGDACRADVGLVSVMTVNNEIGTVQPLEEVADIVARRSPEAVLHTDAVQAVPWLDVAGVCAPAQLVSVSAHKFGGPKGSGALVVRDGTTLRPQMAGGGQERGRRSGTQNVAGAVGMAAALVATDGGRATAVARVTALRDRLADGVVATVPGVVETGPRDRRVAGICHLRVAGVEGEALVVLLDQAGIAVSAGASCSSGAVEPSHVLAAMGLGTGEASSGVRLSLGATTTDGDVDRVLATLPGLVERLRN